MAHIHGSRGLQLKCASSIAQDHKRSAPRKHLSLVVGISSTILLALPRAFLVRRLASLLRHGGGPEPISERTLRTHAWDRVCGSDSDLTRLTEAESKFRLHLPLPPLPANKLLRASLPARAPKCRRTRSHVSLSWTQTAASRSDARRNAKRCAPSRSNRAKALIRKQSCPVVKMGTILRLCT